METNKTGYLLITTLLIIAAATLLVTYIFNRGSVYVPFAHTVIQREKAKVLAMGGLQIAKGMLLPQKDEAKEAKKSATSQKGEGQKQDEPVQFLTQLLPSINRWQKFELHEQTDGIDAQLSICIVCEEGKIDINSVYDFAQHKFRGEKEKQGDWKKLLQEIFKRLEKEARGKVLFQAFEKLLKKRQYKFNDVTELLAVKEFEIFKNNLFYEPPGVEWKEGQRPFYLTDIFTVYSGKSSMEPWLFSDSLAGLLGLGRAKENEVSQRKNKVKEWTKQFKQSATWKSDWNSRLKPLYEKELQTLPEGIDSMLSSSFEPNTFSVFSYATVGSVTQRLCAVVERSKRSEGEKQVYDVSIRKLYWL